MRNTNRGKMGLARSIVSKKCRGRGYDKDSIMSLVWEVRHFYLDSENYPNAFNLRICKKFDSEELNHYYEKAGSYPKKKLYETTVYSRSGDEYYFGFHYD